MICVKVLIVFYRFCKCRFLFGVCWVLLWLMVGSMMIGVLSMFLKVVSGRLLLRIGVCMIGLFEVLLRIVSSVIEVGCLSGVCRVWYLLFYLMWISFGCFRCCLFVGFLWMIL